MISLTVHEVRRRLRTRHRIRAIAVALLFLVTVALTASWVAELAYRPRLTPVIAATVTDYAWPVHPNAWAREDAQRFGTLEDQSVRILDLTPDWRTRELALKRLDSELNALSESNLLTGTVLFSFSLHGVVDSEGRAALLPADADPLDSDTWLPVREVLDHIADHLPPSICKVVLLDSNRSEANWQIGQLHNTFADRLVGAIDKKRHPNCVLVNSTSPDQRSWSSPGLPGSAFGTFVATGLAGAADRQWIATDESADAESRSDGSSDGPPNSEPTPTEGNQDGQVSLDELIGFVNARLEAWCRRHRLPPQTVLRLPAESTDDVDLAWALSEQAFDRLQARLQWSTDPAVSPNELDRLWQTFSQLADARMLAWAPEGLNQLEQRLLRLESLCDAGAAYRQRAKQEAVRLDQRLTQLTATLADPDVQQSLLAYRRSTMDQTPRSLQESELPTRHLNRTVGAASTDEMARAEQAIESLIRQPTSATLEATIRTLESLSSETGRSGTTDEDLQFLRLLNRYAVLEQWPQRQVVRRLLTLRQRAERLAVFQTVDGQQDLRGIRWLRPFVDRADRDRRLAEDYLLAGEAAAGSLIENALDQAEQSADEAAQQLQTVLGAVRGGDEAMRELPYIAQALAGLPRPIPPSTTGTSSPRAAPLASGTPNSGTSGIATSEVNADHLPVGDVVLTDLVIPAIRDAILLSRQIDAGPDIDPSGGDVSPAMPFLDTSQRLGGRMEELHGRLDKFLTHTLKEGRDAEVSALTLAAAMRLPTLTWQQRRQLRQLHSEMLLSQSSSADGAGASSAGDRSIWAKSKPGSVAAGWMPPIDRILSWPSHPAVMLARPERPADAGPAAAPELESENGVTRVEQLGFLVRRNLAAFDADANPSQWMGDPSDPSWWMAAARWQRRLLPLTEGSPSPSPLNRAFHVDLQRLLVWHGRRQLDGFLGSPEQTSGIANRAFFDRACDRCVATASKLGAENASLQAEVARLRQLQVSRRLAAQAAFVTSADHSPVPGGTETDTFQVVVRPVPEGRLSDSSLPEGRPSVWVRSAASSRATESSLVSATETQPQKFDLKTRRSDKLVAEPLNAGENGSTRVSVSGSPTLAAVTTFRGNEYGQSFVANRLGGTLAQYQPFQYGDSRVTVLGDRVRRASILFVLDCSRSMAEPLQAESADDNAPSRLSLAKSALIEMLDELAKNDANRVGVIFFGHRVAWTRSDPPQRSQSPGAGDNVPADLMPSQDVEVVLPLGRFDPGNVFQRLDRVQPWGQSPLNLALINAMKAFSNDDSDTEKSIVVITDGRDYQFTPSRSDIRKPPRIQQADVLDVARQSDVPVYLLGFGLDAADREATGDEFKTIADATGGQASSVDDAGELMRQLRRRLSLGQFSVAGKNLPSSAAPLNQSLAVSTSRSGPGEYRLDVEALSESIPLQGGEAIRIRLSADGRRLLPVPFEEQFPQTVPLTTGNANQSTSLVMRAHRPTRLGQHVRFPVSVQSLAAPVTPRPAEAWLTVTPLRNGSEMSGHRYWFYDTPYQPDRPVPFLDWLATDWPEGADKGRLRFFCKFAKTPPLVEFPLRKVVENPQAYADRTLDEVPSISLQVSTSDRTADQSEYLINVIQRHRSKDADLGRLKVGFETAPSYRPIRVTHQFDSEHGLSSHTFAFDAADASGIERSSMSRIVLTSSAAMRDGAHQPAGGQPIDVELYGAADVVTLRPPQ